MSESRSRVSRSLGASVSTKCRPRGALGQAGGLGGVRDSPLTQKSGLEAASSGESPGVTDTGTK